MDLEMDVPMGRGDMGRGDRGSRDRGFNGPQVRCRISADHQAKSFDN